MIHLDHAATSFPKPAPVLAAMLHWYEHVGTSAERGDSRRCQEARQEVAAARRLVGELMGLAGERVALLSGATEGLNLSLRALLRPGDTVLTTAFEHSSVVRPLVALQRERGLRLEVLPPSAAGGLDLQQVADALRRVAPSLFVFTHASNVTGAAFDAASACALARAAGCTSLLDASQTAGLLDLRVGADVFVGSCHKALHGPPGLGFVAVREGLDLPSQKQGGTGGSRALAEHPAGWPQAFEAGTPNTPAIFGLHAALRWLEAERPERLLQRALAHVDALAAGLRSIAGVRVIDPPPGPRVPVLSLVHDAYDPAELGAMFDAAGVHVRTGFHCAPWLHAHLGTASAGTVRLSPGPHLAPDDVQRALAVLATSG